MQHIQLVNTFDTAPHGHDFPCPVTFTQLSVDISEQEKALSLTKAAVRIFTAVHWAGLLGTLFNKHVKGDEARM